MDTAATGRKPECRYDAFISYRHVEPDRKWAKWLHTALETYRVPKRMVRQQGILPRLRRAFRDEEELPASADLSQEIETALLESRFLIVVCSRRTPDSAWVNKEVVRFRELGRGERILALLIDGEPGESFPVSLQEIRREIVTTDGKRAEEIEKVEPLAADVRSLPARKESQRYLKRMARLRLLACVLGCRFDELRRREHERQVRRLVFFGGFMTVLFAAMGLLAAVATHQKAEAEHQRNLAEAAQKQEAAAHEQAVTGEEFCRAEPILHLHCAGLSEMDFGRGDSIRENPRCVSEQVSPLGMGLSETLVPP